MGTYLKEHLEQEMSHHLNSLHCERTGTRRLVISGAHPGLVKAIEKKLFRLPMAKMPDPLF